MRLPDLFLLIPAALLTFLGLIVTYSITPQNLLSQSIFFLAGALCFALTSQLNSKNLPAIGLIFYFLVIVGLLLTFAYGTITRGSNRWLPIGPFRLQISEFAKPIVIIMTAYIVTKINLKNFIHFLLGLAIIALPSALVFLQPDLGSAIIIIIIGSYSLLAAFPRKRFVILLFIIATLSVPLVWYNLQQYQQNRVLTFLNPQSDPLGASYNQIQAVIAAGSGQIYGKGLGKGTQSHLQFLPEKHTDFFYASLSEEFGFIGSTIVIILYALIFIRLLLLAQNSTTKSNIIIYNGVFILLISQAAIHIGINLGLLPVTGLTLPLLSIGGSSMIATWIALGLASSVSTSNRNDKTIYLQ